MDNLKWPLSVPFRGIIVPTVLRPSYVQTLLRVLITTRYKHAHVDGFRKVQANLKPILQFF